MDRRTSTFQQFNNEIKSFFMHSKVLAGLKLTIIVMKPTHENYQKILHLIQAREARCPVQSVHAIVVQPSLSPSTDDGLRYFGVLTPKCVKLCYHFETHYIYVYGIKPKKRKTIYSCALLVGIICQNIPALKPLFYVDPHWEYCLRTIALANIVVRWGIGLDAEALMINPILPLMLGLLSSTAEVISIILAAVFLFDISVSMAILCGYFITIYISMHSTHRGTIYYALSKNIAVDYCLAHNFFHKFYNCIGINLIIQCKNETKTFKTITVVINFILIF
uniref:Uncharacterized protein n=1 Tax=Heterorhabditis bacteriophora TaxID=37862 RepID=A0A1I7W9F5_HETBA